VKLKMLGVLSRQRVQGSLWSRGYCV